MQVVVNGEEKRLSDTSLTVIELLRANGVEAPEMVSVQLNGEFVDRANYENTRVKEKDEVDFLYFMGGGPA